MTRIFLLVIVLFGSLGSTAWAADEPAVSTDAATATPAEAASDVAAESTAKAKPQRSFPERLWRFFGVLHPAFIHFPIALLTISAVFIALRWKFKGISPDVAFYTLWAGALAAIGATLMGWSFAPQRAYGDMWAGPHADVFWHRWLGVTVTVFSLIVAITATVSRRRYNGESSENANDRAEKWHMGVIISAILVGLVGHQGGLLVYGEDFYNKAFAKLFNIDDDTSVVTPIVTTPPPKPGEKVDFAKHVKPILEAHCIVCHGPDKAKANLELQNKKVAFSTGDMHPDEIVPGKPDVSELYYRISTDDTDDLMPPEDEGGPLPTVQIELIKRWIAEGAEWPDDVTLEDKSK
ncbi:hypothetical protein HED60_20885 [Planctomycetales bacterium ZRK34]|nr:hypothetical protein HED60_20885 [Planctomycetales bacterium ZRK34]